MDTNSIEPLIEMINSSIKSSHKKRKVIRFVRASALNGEGSKVGPEKYHSEAIQGSEQVRRRLEFEVAQAGCARNSPGREQRLLITKKIYKSSETPQTTASKSPDGEGGIVQKLRRLNQEVDSYFLPLHKHSH